MNGIVLDISFDGRDFLNGISAKFQKPCFGIAILIRGKSGDGFTRSILYFKNTACKPCIGKLWRIHGTIIRATFNNSSHLFSSLIDDNLTFCSNVFYIQSRSLVDADSYRLSRAVDYIRADGRKLFHINRTCWESA